MWHGFIFVFHHFPLLVACVSVSTFVSACARASFFPWLWLYTLFFNLIRLLPLSRLLSVSFEPIRRLCCVWCSLCFLYFDCFSSSLLCIFKCVRYKLWRRIEYNNDDKLLMYTLQDEEGCFVFWINIKGNIVNMLLSWLVPSFYRSKFPCCYSLHLCRIKWNCWLLARCTRNIFIAIIIALDDMKAGRDGSCALSEQRTWLPTSFICIRSTKKTFTQM